MNPDEQEGMAVFESAISSEATLKSYKYSLKNFLHLAKLESTSELLSMDTKQLETVIIQVIGKLKSQKLSPSRVRNVIKGTKLFLVMNDKVLNWDKLAKLLPKQNGRGMDRPYSKEEVRHMLAHGSSTVRLIVMFMATAGLRLGALPGLKVSDIKPIEYEGQALGSVTVYHGENEEYKTFITPETYKMFADYVKEEDRKPSDLLFGIGYEAIRSVMYRLVRRARVQGTKNEKNRYEVMFNHGLRKFMRTSIDPHMKTFHAELLLGHGASDLVGKYTKPSFNELLESYSKAIPALTIMRDEIKSKEIETLKAKVEEFDSWKLGMQILRPLLKELIQDSKTEQFSIKDISGTEIKKTKKELLVLFGSE